MDDELRKEVLRILKSGAESESVYDLLIQYKQAGMDKDTMYNVLESIGDEMREIGDEKLEDEIIDYMDYVSGQCFPTWRIYPETFGWQPVMLSVKDAKQINTEFDISFSNCVDELSVHVTSVEYLRQGCETSCTWYLTKGCGLPPVVVEVDCKSGLIVEMNAAKTKSMTPMSFVPPVISQNRDVIVDRSVFTKVNDCICVVKGYNMFKYEGNLVCLFEDEQEPTKAYRNGRFELLIDNCNQIVGFSICDLTEDEIMMIDKLEERS